MKHQQQVLTDKQKINEGKLTRFDFFMCIAGLVIFTAFFIAGLFIEKDGKPGYLDWMLYVSFITNILSVFNLIATIKKRISNVYFGFAWAILSGVVCWFSSEIFNAYRYWVINGAMQIVTLVVWLRHSTNKKTVKTRRSSKKFFWIGLGITLGLTGLFTYFRTQEWFCEPLGLGDPVPWYYALGGVTCFTFSLASAIFFIRRLDEYWIFTLVTSVAGLIIWIGHCAFTPNEFSNWEMFAGAIIDLSFCTKGFLEWYGWLPSQRKGK